MAAIPSQTNEQGTFWEREGARLARWCRVVTAHRAWRRCPAHAGWCKRGLLAFLATVRELDAAVWVAFYTSEHTLPDATGRAEADRVIAAELAGILARYGDGQPHDLCLGGQHTLVAFVDVPASYRQWDGAEEVARALE
jgi:hypothetical protein